MLIDLAQGRTAAASSGDIRTGSTGVLPPAAPAAQPTTKIPKAVASGAEPSFERYNVWRTVVDAPLWVEFTDFDVEGAVGHSLLDHVGVTANSPMCDLSVIEPVDFKDSLVDWVVVTSMVSRKAKPGERGRAIKAHHGMRIACGLFVIDCRTGR